MNFIDNRGMPKEAREVGPEEGFRLFASIDTTDLREKFSDILDNAKLTKRDREQFGDQSLPAEFAGRAGTERGAPGIEVKIGNASNEER